MTKQHYFIDVDEYGFPDFEPHELLEWLKLHIRRVQQMFPKVGKCVVKRSFYGYHAKFLGLLLREEIEMLRLLIPIDSGYNYWFGQRGKATLRIGEKVIVKQVGERFVGKRIVKSKPQVIEMIRNE